MSMKHHEFFSAMQENGEKVAKKQSGYTDGEYNYYAANGLWYCIDPQSGLSVSEGRTRREAQQQAQSLAERIEARKETDSYKGAVERFNELRHKATFIDI